MTRYTFDRIVANKTINSGTIELMIEEISEKYEVTDLIKSLTIDSTDANAGFGFGISWSSRVKLALTGHTTYEREKQMELLKHISPAFNRFFG